MADHIALPLAVSAGEPAGIGLDLIIAAHAQQAASDLPAFTVFGDPAAIDARAHAIGVHCPILEVEPGAASAAGQLPVVPIRCRAPVRPGELNAENGGAVIAAIDEAVKGIAAGQFRGLVTAPIHKAALYEAGFTHPGHTEYLGALAAKYWAGANDQSVMMLAGPDLRTVPVTVHIPVQEVPSALTADLLTRTIEIVAAELSKRFGISEPRIAVAGLNPHAGESGNLGTEDRDLIAPVVQAFQSTGLNVIGPLPADTMFHAEARAAYDVAICMYHDQALIPAKMLAFHDAVNVTLGLPFVRTSPDHGTALSLAGTGKALTHSFFAALRLADDMTALPK